MKIAIMTQPLGQNYGGMMQAWALQQVLKRQGHEVITIDRQPDQFGFLYRTARLGYRLAMKMLGKRKVPLNLEKDYSYILSNTKSFIANNIVMSEPIDSTVKLKAHFERERYDAVVVGSDQTWRPKYSPNIENFFLDFLEGIKIKRIAYASSFGVDDWEFNREQTIRCAELAKLFDAISVREDSGVELCRQYLGVDAQHVLDPTLLLNSNEYEQLIGAERLKEKNEGIFTYFLDKTPEKLAIAEQASKETGEKLFSCQAQSSVSDNHDVNLADLVMPDPRDWLAGFANAKYVLTDSFHGMVFSIVFNKPFYVIPNESRGVSRFDSLLNLIGLNSRKIISNVDDPKLNLFSDQSFVELDEIVDFSKDFLIKCFNAN
ncbi:polysaccharide pyruvyl transferase family protein [Bacterioplanoides pacificum]|uniref:Polysaccharide pyruvyl transferase family protein n=1 Tax=Bacterioplanoides pacificum TaxID=1171596 RepID=A0ABV7VQT8_9GAMM